MAKWTINDYNIQIDKTLTRQYTGKNGVMYEYILPYGANPNNFITEAVDVKSRKKKDVKYNNGKRPGTYQPVGDKSQFIYYKLKYKKKNNNLDEKYLRELPAIIQQFCKEVLD